MKLVLTSLLISGVTWGYSQGNVEVNIVDFIKETQQWVKQDEEMILTWWIPNEYWRIVLSGNLQITPDFIDRIESALQPYTLICAARIHTGLDGSIYYAEEQDIGKTIYMLDQEDNQYLPLPDDQIQPDALTLIDNMEPIFAQMLGEMGKGLHLYFFAGQNSQGEKLIDPTKNNVLKIVHSGWQFKWTTPLTTLLPPKFCPVDKEQMKGNWNYCPLHGIKLDP